MVKSVTTIPARINKKTAMPIDSPRKRRVAAYARVSTDSEEQATSYEAQVDYYTNYIKSRNDWEFVRVYADEGITGTSTKDRVEFKAMINDALDGKIDLIITKSVSRFARNTVDTLTTVRKLKEYKEANKNIAKNRKLQTEADFKRVVKDCLKTISHYWTHSTGGVYVS